MAGMHAHSSIMRSSLHCARTKAALIDSQRRSVEKSLIPVSNAVQRQQMPLRQQGRMGSRISSGFLRSSGRPAARQLPLRQANPLRGGSDGWHHPPPGFATAAFGEYPPASPAQPSPGSRRLQGIESRATVRAAIAGFFLADEWAVSEFVK
ncbi:MAG: hypothetical protein ACJ8G3_05320 [Burkholderiaceae bacterium]